MPLPGATEPVGRPHRRCRLWRRWLTRPPLPPLALRLTIHEASPVDLLRAFTRLLGPLLSRERTPVTVEVHFGIPAISPVYPVLSKPFLSTPISHDPCSGNPLVKWPLLVVAATRHHRSNLTSSSTSPFHPTIIASVHVLVSRPSRPTSPRFFPRSRSNNTRHRPLPATRNLLGAALNSP